MSITLRSNIFAVSAVRRLSDATDRLTRSFSRLSSGSRINKASDDAAGLAVATGLNAKSRVYSQAIRNGNDSISLLNIAEGSLREVGSVLTRIKELAVQAANGSLSSGQRRSLDTEAQSLTNEFNRIMEGSTFNGLRIFDTRLGQIGTQLGFGAAESIGVSITGSLRRNAGIGTFGSATSFGSDSEGQILSADVNNDGKLDLIAAESLGTKVRIYLGNGDGTFASSTDIAVGDVNGPIAAGDFNGDGKIDLAVNGDLGANYVYTGNGDGTFTAGSTFSTYTAGPFNRLLTADVNGDGYLDIIHDSGGNNMFGILLGNGNGTFAAEQQTSTGATNISDLQLGDFNGDGRIDIVTAHKSGNTAKVFFGDGRGSFSLAASLSINDNNRIAVGDLNHDGYDDIISAEGNIQISNGNGTFSGSITTGGSVTPRTYSVGTADTTFQVKLGDINGDGILDIIRSATANLEVSLGNGDGTFRAYNSTAVTIASTFALGDFSGDGAIDIALGYAASLQVRNANTETTSNIQRYNLLTAANARDTMGLVDQVILRVQAQLGDIGSAMSRFTSALNTLASRSENYLAAASRITDVDVADESAKMIREQILQQAGAAVLANAAQQPQLALQLLR